MTNRRLIVNADDFGQSPGVNRGIIQAYEKGVVTSASLMVRWPASAQAAAYAREHPKLSVGLHLDLGEWSFQEGAWRPLYQVVSLQDAAAIKEALLRQLQAFRALVGANPTHLDSHQHLHSREPVRSVVHEIATDRGFPLRHSSGIQYCGSFYGQTSQGEPLPQAITFDSLVKILSDLKPGITELGCHPGLGEDMHTMYSAERRQELEVLCDPRLGAVIEASGIKLCSFVTC
jgi:predicted glycoside hydrolase/deacetylase ChbG (UPF0249 family)